MAGPALGPAIAQGAAAGSQGQSIILQQLLQQLQARAQQQQLQQNATAQQGQGGAYDAIAKLFGGGAGPQPMPVAPPPGQASQPAAPPQPGPGGAPPQANPGGAGPPGAMSPARAVLQGQPVPQANPGGQPPAAPQSMDLQSLVKAVDQAMPNAPPQAKMAALEKVAGLMNAQAQTQFAHMKQQFDMQMQVAKLTQTAQNQLQQSMDRNASIEERADAAKQHNETMRAIADLTASTRESVVDKQQAGATARNTARIDAHTAQVDRTNALREKLGATKLTPEQQLLSKQAQQKTSQLNAVVNSAGPNSPVAKQLTQDLKAINDRLEQSLSQPAPTGPTAATATTTPLRPQGVPEGAVHSPSANKWLDPASGKIYDQAGKVTGQATPEQINAAKGGAAQTGGQPGFADGGEFTVGGKGGTDSQQIAFRATPGERVIIKGPNAPSEVDKVYQGGISPDKRTQALLTAKRGSGALDAR